MTIFCETFGACPIRGKCNFLGECHAWQDVWRKEWNDKRWSAHARFLNGEISQEECDLCGEPTDEEMGEFVQADGEHVFAHAQCGIDARLPQA